MATRSYILKENDDGTFSARYHHWDGYPDGLGVFLHENLGSKERVDWLFGLDRSFSTVMSNKSYTGIGVGDFVKSEYEKCKKSDCAFDFPKDWNVSDDVYVRTHEKGDQGGLLNSTSWERVSSQADEEYTYLFKNGAWHFVILQDEDLSKSVFIKTIDFLKIVSVLTDLDQDVETTLKNLKKKKLASSNSWDVGTKKELQEVFLAWSKLSQLEVEVLTDTLIDHHDFDTEIFLFDQLAKTSLSKKDLEKKIQPQKNAKKLNGSPGRKL